MVSVETRNLLDGQFTRLFKDLYIKTSAKPLPKELPYPVELKSYLDILYGSVGYRYKFVDNKFLLREKCKNADAYDTRCICAFSGGKDSVANALLLRDIGYEPILFFVKGINRSYPQEYETSLELAKELGMEIVIYSLKVSGKCEFIENPTKNQFILALMVDYGVKYNILNYSFGAFREDRVEIMSHDYMLSDAYEMFQSVEKFYKKYISDFQLVLYLNNEAESYYVICNNDVKILNKTFSCMMPLRYKSNLRRNNEKKYGIELLPNRCGSCHKCCIEAIVLNKMGITNYPDEFLKHCEDILTKLDEKQLSSIQNKELSESMDWYDEYFINKYKEGVCFCP